MTEAEQLEHLKACPQYKMASFVSFQSMVFLNFLKNGKRLFADELGLCDEPYGDSGYCWRACWGLFVVNGIGGVPHFPVLPSGNAGSAVCRQS